MSKVETERILLTVAANEEVNQNKEDYVYRISTVEEWEAVQRTGSLFGGELDKTTGCIHLSKLDQNFFVNFKKDLYLLQINVKKLGDGLVYEAVDDSNVFPHFYGPSRSFCPLPLDAVVKAEKIISSDGKFTCTLLS